MTDFMPPPKDLIKARGAQRNLPNRFEKITHDELFIDLVDDTFDTEDNDLSLQGPKTRYFRDHSKSVMSENHSPDIGFRFSVNPYRGCSHGCAYCYARPTHEYLGLSAGLDFESKIFVKEEAPKLLREKLASKSWQPHVVVMSGVTDCYQPCEKNFELTRRCLEVLLEFRNPVAIISKNGLVSRDIDLFKEFAKFQGVHVVLSVTTLDDKLCGILEPRTSRPGLRLKAIEKLAQAGIPVGVNVAPVIPALTDFEMPAILHEAKAAGAVSAGYTMLRLPYGVENIFSDWLSDHLPSRREKILNAVRQVRQGKLNNADFGERMTGSGVMAKNIENLFKVACRKEGLNKIALKLSTSAFRRSTPQLDFFNKDG